MASGERVPARDANSGTAIRVVLADDSYLVREALMYVLCAVDGIEVGVSPGAIGTIPPAIPVSSTERMLWSGSLTMTYASTGVPIVPGVSVAVRMSVWPVVYDA